MSGTQGVNSSWLVLNSQVTNHCPRTRKQEAVLTFHPSPKDFFLYSSLFNPQSSLNNKGMRRCLICPSEIGKGGVGCG